MNLSILQCFLSTSNISFQFVERIGILHLAKKQLVGQTCPQKTSRKLSFCSLPVAGGLCTRSVFKESQVLSCSLYQYNHLKTVDPTSEITFM